MNRRSLAIFLVTRLGAGEVVCDRRIRPLSRLLAACQGGVNPTGNTVEFRY